MKHSIIMGLFKDLLKGVAGDLMSKVQQAANAAMSGTTTSSSQPHSGGRGSCVAPAADAPVRSAAESTAYFAGILASRFPQYSVQRNVPVTDLAGFASDSFQLYKTRPTQAYKAEWGEPYSFVLSEGGVPKGIVMLGSGHSHDANVKYLISRMYAKKLGLPYINFYTQMPNEEEYVVGRIRKFMGGF